MKKNIIVTITIMISIFLVISLTGCTKYAVPYEGYSILYQRSGDDFVKTEVKLSDLSGEYKAKLLTFDNIQEDNWFSDTVLRYVINSTGDASIDETDDIGFINTCNGLTGEAKEELITTFTSYLSHEPNYELGSANTYSAIDDRNAVTLFKSSDSLKDGEIVVSKWKYLAAYVDAHNIKLSLSDIERIIDSKDCFAKYWILRNCGNTHYGLRYTALDVACLQYYGLIPEYPAEVISVKITSHEYAKEGKDTFKIVGYYENGCEAAGMELLDKEIDITTARTIGNALSENREDEPYKTYYETFRNAFLDVGPVYFKEVIVLA